MNTQGQISGKNTIFGDPNGTFGGQIGTSAGTKMIFTGPNGTFFGTKTTSAAPITIVPGTKMIFSGQNGSFSGVHGMPAAIRHRPHLLRNGLKRRPGLKAKDTQGVAPLRAAY